MKIYVQTLGLNLTPKEKDMNKEIEKMNRKNIEQSKKKENKKQKDLMNTIKELNQQIAQMREIMVEIYHIVINNPENKEKLLEKMKQIEEIEYKEIEVEVELNEEKTKKESKRKVQFSSENEEKTYDLANQPYKIRMPDN